MLGIRSKAVNPENDGWRGAGVDGKPRDILHVDMDAFYAAVEQRDRPELRGKPVLVGGDPRGRGVVATASYEARPFGCHSAMPMAQAVRLCPQAIIVHPRFERYAQASRQVFAILESYTPLVEPLSIDEAFLDVSGSTRLFGAAEHIAREIKARIAAQTGLTASVGLAPSKFVAKLASDLRKPDGLVVVPRDQVQAFLDPLPIGRLWGVGKATLPRFEALGVRTFADLRQLGATDLTQRFGESGEHYYRLVRGDDDRPVVPDREAKSISHETTFAVDIADPEYLRSILLSQVEQVAQRLRRHGLTARTVSVKIRTADFKTITRHRTLPDSTAETYLIWTAVAALFQHWAAGERRPVRLIGAGVEQLAPEGQGQLALFADLAGVRRRTLDRTVDAIRERFGRDAITHGEPPTAADE